ncbi:MAG: TackOD1 domain-containing metal-binding protein [Promethearchaeota archaeon]
MELTTDEKALLTQLIDKGVKTIESKTSLEGITYEGLDDILKEYGEQRLRNLLEALANKKYLAIKERDPTLFCPKCHSIHVYSRYTCSRCQSVNVNRIELIEHPFCGYTGVKKNFILGSSLMCPNCKTGLGSIDGRPPGDGSREDYRVIGSSFECEECGNRFNKPDFLHICQKCGEVFDYQTATYEKIHDYELPEHIRKTMREMEGYNILLVEDDPADADVITRYVAKAEAPMIIEKVDSGVECLEKIEQKHFDLLLLDYNLPDMDGLQIINELKKKKIDIPIIMLTGVDDRTTAVEVMKLGISDYLVKSLETYKELPQKIIDILDEKD